jgi:hypothetical protein
MEVCVSGICVRFVSNISYDNIESQETFFYNKKAKVIKHGNILPIRVQTESLSGTLN